ncbi:hypothetical protein [Streptomyces rimosus]
MTLSPIPRRSGRLLSTAVAVGLAVTAGPLTVPASAAAPAAPVAFAAPASAASVGKLAPGSRIVSAGTTGYLSADPQGKVVWTRYADGSTTQLAQDKADYGFGTEHGTASDVVALGDDPVMGASKKITLRDMATGTSGDADRFAAAGLGAARRTERLQGHAATRGLFVFCMVESVVLRCGRARQGAGRAPLRPSILGRRGRSGGRIRLAGTVGRRS